MNAVILDIPPAGETLEVDLDVDWDAGSPGKPTRLAARLSADERIAHRLVFSARFSFEGSAPCARCLETARFQVEDSFETILDTDRNTVEAADLEAGEEPATFRLIPPDQIDVTEEIEQRLTLALPGIVLCSADCRGLCAVCGANLNEGDCPHSKGE